MKLIFYYLENVLYNNLVVTLQKKLVRRYFYENVRKQTKSMPKELQQFEILTERKLEQVIVEMFRSKQN